MPVDRRVSVKISTPERDPREPANHDLFVARMSLIDPDLIAKVGHQEYVLKDVADLVPGDAFVIRGRVHDVVDFPDVFAALGYVWISVADNHGFAIEAVLGAQVPTWRTRAINYGTRRCPQCWVNVGRDHTPDECLLLQQERQMKNSEE